MAVSKFNDKRLERLADQDNSNASPEDILEMARQYLDEIGPEQTVIIIQQPKGGVTVFSAGGTQAEVVYLCESAKLSLMLRDE